MRYTSALTLALYTGLITYLGFLTLLGVGLDHAVADRLFSEAGPFEILSMALWLLLGVLLIAGSRPTLARRLALGAAAALLAAREAGLHKVFTSGSPFNTNYYESSAVPLAEKLVAAPVVLAALALLGWMLVAGARAVLRGGPGRAWRVNLAVGVGLVALAKAVDRAPSLLGRHFGVEPTAATGALLEALEEGGEMALPLVFAVVLLQYRASARSAAGAHARGDAVDARH